MRIFTIFFIAIAFAMSSCTLDKTDYEAELSEEVTEFVDFKEVIRLKGEDFDVSVEALNGAFYKGYNEVRIKFSKQPGTEKPKAFDLDLLVGASSSKGEKVSCPHSNQLIYDEAENYYSGYIVFTGETTAEMRWDLEISFAAKGKTQQFKQEVLVEKQTNKNLNMTAFTANDGEQYVIALVAPQKPKVAENELVAGIYKKPGSESSGGSGVNGSSFTEAVGYTLKLDPRMPEPSMGNHSSPNNRDLTQHSDKLYRGVVNYTMTGNWTLNFILLNHNGQIVKGTVVPTDFTPGVEGAKSELHIDILF